MITKYIKKKAKIVTKYTRGNELICSIYMKYIGDILPGKNESRRDRFVRVAERRTNAILEKIRVLGNCSNRSMYEYTQEDIDGIFKALNRALRDTKLLFEHKSDSKFRLATRK